MAPGTQGFELNLWLQDFEDNTNVGGCLDRLDRSLLTVLGGLGGGQCRGAVVQGTELLPQ